MVANGHLLAIRLCQQGSEERGGVLYTPLGYDARISPRSISPAMTHIRHVKHSKCAHTCMCLRVFVSVCVRGCMHVCACMS